MSTIKTTFILEDRVSPALNNIGNVGNTVLSDMEKTTAAVNKVMNHTADSTSQTAVSLSKLSTAGSGLISQSRSFADVLEAEAQKAQNLALKHRERADQMASAADYARKYHESLKSEILQTDNLTEAMEDNAQAALEEAERLEKAAKAAEQKALKSENAAKSAEKMSESAKKTAQAEERLYTSANMIASAEKSVAGALDRSEKEAKEYSKAITEAAEESENLGKKGAGAITDLRDVLVNAGIVMGLKKMGNAFLECSQMAAEFESGIAKVSTIADTSRASLSTIEADIMSLSRKTGQSAGDITEAAYQAMSASVDTASAVQFVDEANKLAVVYSAGNSGGCPYNSN